MSLENQHLAESSEIPQNEPNHSIMARTREKCVPSPNVIEQLERGWVRNTGPVDGEREIRQIDADTRNILPSTHQGFEKVFTFSDFPNLDDRNRTVRGKNMQGHEIVLEMDSHPHQLFLVYLVPFICRIFLADRFTMREEETDFNEAKAYYLKQKILIEIDDVELQNARTLFALFREFAIKVMIWWSIFQNHASAAHLRFGHGGRVQSTFDTWPTALDMWLEKNADADPKTIKRMTLALTLKQAYHIRIRIPVSKVNWTNPMLGQQGQYNEALRSISGPTSAIADLLSTSCKLPNLHESKVAFC